MRLRYTVVMERGESSWGAHVPDLPGCVAVGDSRAEALALIRDAVQLHIDGLGDDDMPVPEPVSESAVVEVDAT